MRPAIIAFTFLSGFLSGFQFVPGLAQAAEMTVYKSPYCGCCKDWIKHVEAAGYAVKVLDKEDMDGIKEILKVPEPAQSCHTAVVGDYIIEGHVPAADIDRLLRERPEARGLAVPGMPAGSPGMEVPDTPADPYTVFLFDDDGASVYARY